MEYREDWTEEERWLSFMLKKQLLKEADMIRKEVESNPEVMSMCLSPEADARIRKNIQEHTKRKK